MNTNKLICKAVVSLAFLFQTLDAQESQNISLLSNYGRGEGESKAVFAAGSLVYYGLGSKMQIASFTNPSSPVKIGSVILSDVVESLVRTSINSTQYIVASGGSKLWLMNVQDPTKPTLTSTTEVGAGAICEGVATSGSYAYVAAGGAGFKVYSISNPAAPTLVASIDTLEYCESVVISTPYAYIAAASRSHIVDISNPSAPVYIGRINAFGYHQYLNVRSGYAYVCNYDAGIAVVNVSNPSNPVNVLEISSMPRTGCIVFDGNYAYVAVGDSGMKIFSVVNPAAPSLVGSIVTTGRAAFLNYGAVSISGTPTGHIFVSNRNPAPGISAINVSIPASPTTSSFLAAVPSPTGTAYTPFYANGKVYVAYGTAGLCIVDVTNPSAAALLSTTALGGDSRAVVVSGNYAYVAARDSGVFVVDVTNVASPVKLNTVKTKTARGVAVSGNYLYVAASDSGMGVIDITNPASAALVGYSHPGGLYGENIAVKGNVAGLTDYFKITFFDVTTQASPVAQGSTPTFRTGNEGFAIEANYAYVPDGDSLKIFNITNPVTPTLVSKVKTGGYGYTAAVEGNYCYVASEATGVRAINISNPASPVEAGYYDGVPQSRGIVANGSYVYVAEKTDGLSVYSNDLVTSVDDRIGRLPEFIALHQNFPNPFNPTTRISFDLHATSYVKLQVLNVLGQTVAELLTEELSAGSHSVEFNAKNLSSGVYFYRLMAGDALQVKRMTLLK